MTLRFHNTLTNRVEDFEPLVPGKVGMYSCGPTVYGDQHVGNFRTYLFADLLRRYLEYRGYEVRQVMNLTDVGHLSQDDIESGEDKIVKKARELGWDPYKVAEHYAATFFRDRDLLGFRDAYAFPKATDHVPEMIEMIQALLDKGFAYKVGGNVYYDVSKFEGYGKLSGNTLEKIKSGATTEINPEKRHPADFALWKTDEKHLMQFDAPWGRGYPGWHIECSAMSRKYLGETFDIHTGGEDNIFPHHESEIAQSEATTGKPFVRYWVHPRFLTFEGEKVAKSKGTELTIHNLANQGYDPMAMRYALISTHYRQQLKFEIVRDGDRIRVPLFEESTKALDRLREFKRRLTDVGKSGRGEPGEGAADVDALLEKSKKQFEGAMDDDLNFSGALSVLHDMARDVNRAIDADGLGSRGARRILDLLERLDSVFGVLGAAGPEEKAPPEVEDLVRRRQEARAARDFKAADGFRDQIRALGWAVEDGKEGPKLKKLKS